MSKKNFLLIIICVCMISACGRYKLRIPTSDDLVIFAWKESWLPGSTSSYIFAASSDRPGIEFNNNLQVLNMYPEWSPNGKWILKLTSNFRELSIINTLSGEELSALVLPKNAELYDASWSPDSTKIICTTWGQDTMEMRWIDVSCIQQGAHCKPDEHFLHFGFAPDWSSDGNSIAFAWDPNTNIQGQGKDNIYIMNLDNTGQPTKISGPLEDCSDPDWSPDGLKLVFSCKYDIFTSNIDGSNLVNLTGGISSDLSEPWLPEDSQPKWNPDGNQIAFLSQHDNLGKYVGDLDTPRSNALYIMDADGQNVKRITLEDQIAISFFAWILAPK